MKKGIEMVTNIRNVDAMLDSEYGRIRYEDWCNNEVARIGAGTYVYIKTVGKERFCFVAK